MVPFSCEFYIIFNAVGLRYSRSTTAAKKTPKRVEIVQRSYRCYTTIVHIFQRAFYE